MTEMTNQEKRARVICGLYNNSMPLGYGILQASRGKLDAREAWDMAVSAGAEPIYLDYYRGRIIKCNVAEDGSLVNGTRLYDRDLGEGACDKAVADGLTDPSYDFSEFVKELAACFSWTDEIYHVSTLDPAVANALELFQPEEGDPQPDDYVRLADALEAWTRASRDAADMTIEELQYEESLEFGDMAPSMARDMKLVERLVQNLIYFGGEGQRNVAGDMARIVVRVMGVAKRMNIDLSAAIRDVMIEAYKHP